MAAEPMTLVCGWEGGKFVQMVMRGDKILHRISMTPDEWEQVKLAADQGHVNKTYTVNTDHKQME